MRRALAILLPLLTLPLYAQYAETDNNQVIRIEGTEMAQLLSVTEVLAMLPGVSIENDEVTIIGRGTPAIYIGNRKSTELSELRHITADRVKEIEVLRYPGAEYGKSVESVIVIRLKPDETERWQVDNTLRLDLTHKLSTSEEISLRWRREALTVGALIGWNEERRRIDRTVFTNRYKDQVLISEEQSLVHPDIRKQALSARLMAEYVFNPDHRLMFNYSFVERDRDRIWMPEYSQLIVQPDKRHDFALEYSFNIGDWRFALGNNSFIDDADQVITRPSVTSYYLRKQYDLRSFFKASREIGKGSFFAGIEHELDHMNVRMHEDNQNDDPDESLYLRTHTTIPDHILGAYASVNQKWGRWAIEAGLRYEHRYSVYRPCEDDGLLRFLDDFGFEGEYDLSEKYYLLPLLLKERELSYKDDDLYPLLTVSTSIGGSVLSLKHTQNRIHPYLGVTRLRVSEADNMQEKILWPEKVLATTLEWKYKWANLAASYMEYVEPICSTLSSSTQYNAPDYEAMNLDLTLQPKIGIWSPMLHAHVHKQWFDMPLASGKDRLKKPLASITLNNTLVLPHDWIMRLNALWHSRGAERNIYYYSSDCRMDVSIQKNLPRQGLTLILNAYNLLRGSYNDQSRYVQAYNGVSQGLKERNVRMVSLSVRYKL